MTVAYVTMPGTSGNYVSTADVNLVCDADTAHGHQSKGLWQAPYYLANSQIDVTTQSAAMTPVIGDFHLAGSPAASDRTTAQVASNNYNSPRLTAIAGSTQYTISAYVSSDQAGMRARIVELQLTSVPDPLTPSSGSWGNITVGQWTHISLTFTSHATAVQVLAQIQFSDQDGVTNLAATDVFYWDALCVRAGSSSSFVPSTRIVGDLDMRARMTATDATPASAETLIGQRSGNSGYAMTLGTGGELVVYHGTGSGTRAETSSGLALVAATDTVVRSVIDISAGTWTHYKNGVQFDTSGSFATTAGSPYAGPLAVGADSAGTSGNWDGDIYYCEVRDGIDGPVVRRFDADDLIGLV